MKILNTYAQLVEKLMDLRDPISGVWTGQLSSSALSTSLALSALESGDYKDRKLSHSGAQWLVDNVNSDGGWGDTPESPSNLSTSLIARASLLKHKDCKGAAEALSLTSTWIMQHTCSLSLEDISGSLNSIYKKDKTFAVPILMFLAMCSDDENEWVHVPKLPFLLALLPGWCYRFLRIEVVSYALPALIAVGVCRHIKVASLKNKMAWGKLFAPILLHRLERLQPEHGGFLDAAPLTAFVVLALQQCGYDNHAVVAKGCRFLRASVTKSGSWPIDSNLRIWVSSLSIRALSERLKADPDSARKVAQWLLLQQQLEIHPYTGAAPGGWAWTDLPGGVPDADDTAAALIALFHMKEFTAPAPLTKAVRLGLSWIMNLQNRDGGVPTFCRGWGKLPFDKSCCDITAHALEALVIWKFQIERKQYIVCDDIFMRQLNAASRRMVNFLESAQDNDGAWLPLWFGHQQSINKLNHIIGTARVVQCLHTFLLNAQELNNVQRKAVSEMVEKAEIHLIKNQKPDGGWSAGNNSTVEETALVISALIQGSPESSKAAHKGADWLVEMHTNNTIKSAPIGLYFSVLWYDEALYPLIWSVEALKKIKDNQ